MQRPKKESHKGNVFEKNSCASKIPHPPHNFSNGPSLKPWQMNDGTHESVEELAVGPRSLPYL